MYPFPQQENIEAGVKNIRRYLCPIVRKGLCVNAIIPEQNAT
jgi:hypothetical protein